MKQLSFGTDQLAFITVVVSQLGLHMVLLGMEHSIILKVLKVFMHIFLASRYSIIHVK